MRRLYFFALFLVLFEFAAYSANDMIMPGMIQVIQNFHAPQSFVALALSLYILGNTIVMLPVGSLAERYGKGRIMIIGNFFFLLFTLLIMTSQNINQFMIWRFLQGSGMAIIGIGYALIHENFDDKNAVKLTALMSNVTILAPLIGPAIGSGIVSFLSWKYVFIITSIISAITLVGLYQFNPHHDVTSKVNAKSNISQYIHIIKDSRFFWGAICLTFGMLPVLFWISQAPNLILYKLHQSYLHYAIYQLISIGGLTISTIVMQFIAGRYPIYWLVKIGSAIMLLGLLISLIGSVSMMFIVGGLFIYTFGLGITNGCIIRLVMSIKELPTGMVASMLTFIQTLLFVIGIAVINIILTHFDFSLLSFTVSTFVTGAIAYMLTNWHISTYRERAWE